MTGKVCLYYQVTMYIPTTHAVYKLAADSLFDITHTFIHQYVRSVKCLGNLFLVL